jgi:peptidoglycan/LPS O-acetylase OafA/YrhL
MRLGYLGDRVRRWLPDAASFELGGPARLLPMEGLRGIAVGLVFLQHYCMQFLVLAPPDGATHAFAAALRNFGNRGVELFFVLSGFLIYGILLRRRPALGPFLWRRAQRLYPAFLPALAIGAALDIWRPEPKIPGDAVNAALYLLANLAFLPGLLPIPALFVVNWSLSYEWWFYVTCAVLVGTLGLGGLPRGWRVAGILGVGAAACALAAAGVPGVPVRGLSLLAGMLLAEAAAAGWRPVPAWLALPAFALAFALGGMPVLPEYALSAVLAAAFYAMASAAFQGGSALGRALSWRWLRWFGNMSYSFYLVHAFVVLAGVRAVLRLTGAAAPTVTFWAAMPVVFALAAAAGAALFCGVERPLSLARRPGQGRRPWGPVKASP